ncbi:MAG: DnaA N-terminal domain-containing protein, partial [Candidatus Saccharimonadales bacterium]
MESINVSSTMGQDRLWQTVLGDIEISLSRANYLTWFKNTHLVKQTDSLVVVGVPNVFIKQQLEKKYTQLIKDTVHKNGLSIEAVEYKIQASAPRSEDESLVLDSVVTRQLSSQKQAVPSAGGPSALGVRAYRQGINERYTFESFIVGAGNELAYAACQAVAAEV